MIKDVSGGFCSDTNWRTHNVSAYRQINQDDDLPGLTPEKLVAWYKAIGSKFLWHYFKWQSGHVSFPSKTLPRMKHLSSDFFQRTAELARKEGMYVCAYTCGGDDFYACHEHPEWFERYGFSFACLNATPFWEREFAAVQEALRLFPCDGLFYDMIQFDGRCRCAFCMAAYKNFYGEEMPKEHNIHKFRFDTFKQWGERAIGIAREIVPTIEICINQQWIPEQGVPYKLLARFDWLYCEYTSAEWIGEIMRAWVGEKPIFCGNAVSPCHVARLLAKGVRPLVYDTLTDYRTGKFVSLDDRRVCRIKDFYGETEKKAPYLRDAVALSHSAVLFTSDHDLSKVITDAKIRNKYLLPHEANYSNSVAGTVRDLTRMNLTCCRVEVAEMLTREKLEKYEMLAVPDMVWIDKKTLSMLVEWVKGGGILFVSGLFALADDKGEIFPTFADDGLTGVRRVDGPLPVFSVLTNYRDGKNVWEMEELAAIDNAIICASAGAKPVAYGVVGADDNVPLIWRNQVGKGTVFYFAGRFGKRIDEDTEKAERSMRRCLTALLSPFIKKAPFKTTLEYPAEVWLNKQPREHRLVLHVIAYEKPLRNQNIYIWADLIEEGKMELVYPDEKKISVKGIRNEGYVRFMLPEVYGHVLFTLV